MTVTASNITAMGFTGSMFGIDDATLNARIEDVITEQSDLIEDRVGAASFSLGANQKAVDRAVKCKTGAEMARQRIIHMSANTVFSQAEGTEAKHLQEAIKDWENQAEKWIAKITDGTLTDAGGFAVGCTVSESDSRRTYPSS